MISSGNQASELLNTLLSWLFDHYIEITATLTGLIYIVFSVRGKILLWLFGLISSSLYVYVYFRSKIYALMGINIYYVFISIYGWLHWKFPGKKNPKELPITRVKPPVLIWLLGISLVLFLMIIVILKKYTDSDVAVWDAFIASFSITATWMLARKIMEHWLIWIVVDMVAIILSLYKGLYPTVALYVCYTTLAMLGYREWLKLWKHQQEAAGASS